VVCAYPHTRRDEFCWGEAPFALFSYPLLLFDHVPEFDTHLDAMAAPMPCTRGWDAWLAAW